MDAKTVAAHWEGNADAWTKYSRAGYDRYRDALNTPAFLAMLPPVAGLHGLDLGCGEGTNTRAVAELGARMTGLDIAPTFLRHARKTEAEDPRGIDYVLGDGLGLGFEDGRFHFVTAFMSMMDMSDQAAVLAEVWRVLKPGGFLQFSILHPCFVPPKRRNIRDAQGEPVAVEIADYFRETDGEVESWLFSSIPEAERQGQKPFTVPRFHRTLSSWVSMIVGAGLTIEAFGEPMASLEQAAAEPVVADTRVAPIFLHIRARKPVDERSTSGPA
jgi:ubiquinone/menaquinone biosynthesis C-methylase UbiE